MSINDDSVEPVSYTHLDVYKRQLKFFTYNVEVGTVVGERIKEDKSLVDHKLLPVFQKQYIRLSLIHI